MPRLLLSAALLLASCESYVAPPRPSILGLGSGTLDDPRAPIVVDFGTPVDPATVSVKIALAETDIEGNLGDEDADPATSLHVLAARTEVSGATLTLTPEAAFPVGPALVLLVEGGLRSTSGRVSQYRVRIPFSYAVKCTTGATRLASGNYFFLFEVEQPLGVQLHVFASLTIDQATGAMKGTITSAERNAGLKCPATCSATDVCRLLPAPACVAASTPAGTVDEYPDFVSNPAPPTGYSFSVEGCATDSAGATGLLTAPATLAVESPAVTAEGLVLSASFATGEDGVARATGSLSADVVRIGTTSLGAGKGSVSARSVAP